MHDETREGHEAPVPIRKWDPIVRMTHWGIVAAVAANALFVEEGSGWHIWIGYAAAGLLALRIVWGMIGSAEARFSAFPPSLRAAADHVSQIRRGETPMHGSHNPLGSLMVYALWACLAIMAATGIAMSGPPPSNPNLSRHERNEIASPNERVEPQDEMADEEEREGTIRGAAVADEEDGEYGEEEGGEEEEGLLVEMHELAANLLYILVALHILGVIFESRRTRRNLVKPMLWGTNNKDHDGSV